MSGKPLSPHDRARIEAALIGFELALRGVSTGDYTYDERRRLLEREADFCDNGVDGFGFRVRQGRFVFFVSGEREERARWPVYRYDGFLILPEADQATETFFEHVRQWPDGSVYSRELGNEPGPWWDAIRQLIPVLDQCAIELRRRVANSNFEYSERIRAAESRFHSETQKKRDATITRLRSEFSNSVEPSSQSGCAVALCLVGTAVTFGLLLI
jgi:hypothetical protein